MQPIRALFVGFLALAGLLSGPLAAYTSPARSVLDPRGKIHIPIGIADSLDTLKTFVEAEGNFSPGFGSYGIYFWLWDEESKRLYAPTMEDAQCEHGLAPGGYLIPWSRWNAGPIEVKTEVCEVSRMVPPKMEEPDAYEKVKVYIVGARVHLVNRGKHEAKGALYIALRSLGAAGWPVNHLESDDTGHALLVDGHVAVWSEQQATRAGVLLEDHIGHIAMTGLMPTNGHPYAMSVEGVTGDCSGALKFEVTLAPGQSRNFALVCPVLPGGRAARHQWDGTSPWAQFDLAAHNPPEGGIYQFDPGPKCWDAVKVGELFNEAAVYWQDLAGRVTLNLPDPRWAESFAAITSHSALCLNEGAPDVAVVNYNVFNRDGVYIANILQKAGRSDFAERAINYFLAHPFNGRVEPEADNPGQVLWIVDEQWKFMRDKAWLARVYPAAQQIAAIINYCRNTSEPHWVSKSDASYGDGVLPSQRKKLKPGACDGFHPEYTEAFDIAGLRAATMMAEALTNSSDASAWRKLAESFFEKYDQQFGSRLAKDYGSYSVLWPTHLYPFTAGKAFEQFKGIGAQSPASWRYFALATAHQGLLTGNRAAGFETLNRHLQLPQMQGWYALDEGGDSGVGGWNHVRTTWRQGKASDAMPHGWAIAEFILLLRDCLAFEDGDKLVLFAGIPPDWITRPEGMKIKHFPTHFGNLSLEYTVSGKAAKLILSGTTQPAGGLVLRLPASLNVAVKVDGQNITGVNGDFLVPGGRNEMQLRWP